MSRKVTAPALHHKVAGNGDSDKWFGESRSKLLGCLRPSSAAKTAVRMQHANEQDFKINRKDFKINRKLFYPVLLHKTAPLKLSSSPCAPQARARLTSGTRKAAAQQCKLTPYRHCMQEPTEKDKWTQETKLIQKFSGESRDIQTIYCKKQT